MPRQHQSHSSSMQGFGGSEHMGGGGAGSSSSSGSVGGGSLGALKSSPSALGTTVNTPNSSGNIRDQQVDKLIKEVKQLRQKVDVLDKENMALKKSVYQLSAQYADALLYGAQAFRPKEMSYKAQQAIADAVQQAGGDLQGVGTTGFDMRYELKGHAGAVYSVEFSPSGTLLASGSFDKTVRIWDTASAQKEMMCFKGHTLNVSSVAWTPESDMLLSGSYDETCKTWDIETGKLVGSFDTEGLVQSVAWDYVDANLFYCGTSRKMLTMFDIRQCSSEYASSIRNESMINTVYASRDGVHVITGDAQGLLKVWDVRSKQCITCISNDTGKMPITHIAIGRRRSGTSRHAADDYYEPRYMAVNSYDNVLRVYDRGLEPPKSDTRLLHALKGFTNRNWPIKSSFYCGTGYNPATFSHSSGLSRSDLASNDQSITDSDLDQHSKPKEETSVLLASGSADPYAYLFNVGEESAEMVQRLEGHTDRVYTVNFHPSEPILASGSADFTVKVWGPAPARGKKKTTL